MDTFTIPPGKATGCLIRAKPFAAMAPAFSDVLKVIPRDQWGDLIGQVSLKDNVTTILDQNSTGSCATESAAQGIMALRAWEHQPYVALNPWSIYAFTSGGVDRGSNIDTNLDYLARVGCLPESIWPRSKGWQRKPPQSLLDEHACDFRIAEWFDIATVDEIGTALLKGFPVVFGWRGHSCLFVELLDRDKALYVNSWGADWGDAGFGILSLSAVNFNYGAFAIRGTTDSGD